MKRLLLIVLFNLVSVLPLLAQVATIPQAGTIVGSIELNSADLPVGFYQDLYVVPSGVQFKITDILISNSGPGYACARIKVGILGARRTNKLVVAPGMVFEHGFLNGIDFTSGQVVTVFNGCNGLAWSGMLSVAIRGYVLTVP